MLPWNVTLFERCPLSEEHKPPKSSGMQQESYWRPGGCTVPEAFKKNQTGPVAAEPTRTDSSGSHSHSEVVKKAAKTIITCWEDTGHTTAQLLTAAHGRMYDNYLCDFIRMRHFFLCVITQSCLLRKLKWLPFIIYSNGAMGCFE